MIFVNLSPGLNILIVEDDSNLRESLADALRGRGHFVRGVDCADAIPEQRDLLQIDLVIVDVNLPGEDGLSLVRRLRVTQPKLGIIILSARAQMDSRAAGYAHGADIYITKPASLKELDGAVLAVTRHLKSDIQQPRHQRLTLYPTNRTLEFDGRPISLTKAEVNLLVAWVRAPQNTLTHSEIVRVLNINGEIKKNLIELFVSRLRKKLPISGGVLTSIKAIRGRGYQLCIPVTLM